MKNTSIFQKLLPHLIALACFLAASVIYFSPQVSGKVIQAHDTNSYLASSKELRDFKKDEGEITLWTNSMFGGMPTYQISAGQPTNVLKYVEKTSNLFIPRPIGYFFAMMLGFYALMVLLGVNPWLSIIGAIAFSLTTNNLVLFGAGHMTKLRTFAYFGVILAGVILAFRKQYLRGGILFALGLGINLYANHIQMTYYFFLFLGLYGLMELFHHYKSKDMPSFGKAVLYLSIGGLVAIGSSASGLLTTYEYSKDTMRGKPILEKEKNAQETSSNTEGLDLDYAMVYSNGWLDLFSSFIPGVVGGAGGEKISKKAKSAKYFKGKAPLYWGAVGKQSSTGGPVYFGAAMFFLFFLGLLVVKGPLKWGIGAGVVLTMLLSLGDSFLGFNQLIFDYLPLYNKFRTPNSVLAITSFLVPVLGTLAVSEILKGNTSKKELLKSLYISTGVIGGICLFFAVLGGSFFDFTYGIRDKAYEAYPDVLTALKSDRRALMQSDSLRSLLFVVVAAGLLWAFLTDKIKTNILLIGLAVITFADLWGVGKRYLGNDSFQVVKTSNPFANPRPVDTKILADKTQSYRVHDLSRGFGSSINSAMASYYHKTVGGYHPAKLQRIQDLIERHIGPESSALTRAFEANAGAAQAAQIMRSTNVLNMLNTKYVIKDANVYVENPSAFGNAWFVENTKSVPNANEEINSLRGTDLRRTAVVHQEFNDYINGMNIQKNGNIVLQTYKPNRMTYQSNSTSEQLAVFSEMWYGPDKGWQAYIDGQPVDHIRTNYALRALKVPAGQHTIEFEFNPKKYNIGKMITLVCSLIILAGLLWLIYNSFQPSLNNDPEVEERQPKVIEKKAPVKKTVSKKKKKK